MWFSHAFTYDSYDFIPSPIPLFTMSSGSHHLMYLVVHSWQTFSWLMQKPVLNFLGGWIKSSLRANIAVFGCPALKMFAPLLPGRVVSVLCGMCIHMCTNSAKCTPSGHSIGQYGVMATPAQPRLLLLLNLLHV